MYKRILIAVTAAASVAGPVYAQTTGSAAGVVPVIPATSAALPAGMVIAATLDKDVSMANKRGAGVQLTVTQDVKAKDGSVAIPAGTVIQGRVTGVHNSVTNGDPNVIRLKFNDISVAGKHHPLKGDVIGVYVPNKPAGSPIGNIVSEQDANALVSAGKLAAGKGTVITMSAPVPKGAGTFYAGTVFSIRLAEGIQMR